MKKIITKSAFSLGLVLSSLSAWAHPGHGASHAVENSFLSGLLHPIIGIDHLVGMLALGLFLIVSMRSDQSNNRGKTFLNGMMVFSLTLIAGGVLAIQGVNFALVDFSLASTLFCLGLLLISMKQLSNAIAFGLIAVFALIHGYGHGLAMPLTASFSSYAAGFLIATLGLIAIGLGIGSFLQQRMQAGLIRTTGFFTGAAGMLMMVSA